MWAKVLQSFEKSILHLSDKSKWDRLLWNCVWVSSECVFYGNCIWHSPLSLSIPPSIVVNFFMCPSLWEFGKLFTLKAHRMWMWAKMDKKHRKTIWQIRSNHWTGSYNPASQQRYDISWILRLPFSLMHALNSVSLT